MFTLEIILFCINNNAIWNKEDEYEIIVFQELIDNRHKQGLIRLSHLSNQTG